MDWMRQIDGYCERLDASYWAEPLNAVTNAAFVIAALIMWRRAGAPIERVLCGILAAIGIGSYLFHTHATVWAVTADVLPILMFSLLYIYAANRQFWGLTVWPALGLTAMFFPFAAAVIPLVNMVPGLQAAAGYAPLPILIAIYAFLLRNRLPQVARGLAIGTGLLVLSLTFRSLDEPLCATLPAGTHFLWHCCNALMLGWMIEVLRRHRLAAYGAQG